MMARELPFAIASMATADIGVPHARHVLVADPDQQRLDTYAIVLQKAGYDVIGVVDPAAALAETARLQPDLVLVRLGEPRSDGLAFCQRMRAGAETRDTPVIVLTRQDDAYVREQVVRAGGTAILTEPLKHTLLLRQVRRLLARVRPRGG